GSRPSRPPSTTTPRRSPRSWSRSFSRSATSSAAPMAARRRPRRMRIWVTRCPRRPAGRDSCRSRRSRRGARSRENASRIRRPDGTPGADPDRRGKSVWEGAMARTLSGGISTRGGNLVLFLSSGPLPHHLDRPHAALLALRPALSHLGRLLLALTLLGWAAPARASGPLRGAIAEGARTGGGGGGPRRGEA